MAIVSMYTNTLIASAVMLPPKTKMVNAAMSMVVCRMASESFIALLGSHPASSIPPPHLAGKLLSE